MAGGLWDSLAGLAEDIGERGVKPLIPDMANEGLAADKALVDRLQGDRSAQVGHAADSAIGAIELTAALATAGTGGVLTQGGKQAVKEGLEQAADSAGTLARRDTLLDADAVRRAMEADHQRQMDDLGPWVGGQPLSAQNQKAIDAAWLREVGEDISSGVDGQSVPVAKGVAPAKRDSNQTVLGSYPDYVNLSDEIGARRFEIPTDVWNRMSPAERWGANQQFLDRMISKGDEVILSNPANSAQRGTTFFREIEYMKSQGYRVSDDGLRMVPGN